MQMAKITSRLVLQLGGLQIYLSYTPLLVGFVARLATSGLLFRIYMIKYIIYNKTKIYDLMGW